MASVVDVRFSVADDLKVTGQRLLTVYQGVWLWVEHWAYSSPRFVVNQSKKSLD